MATLLVSGRRERIPPFPHHKDYVLRCRKFFFFRSPLEFLLIRRAIALREFFRGIRHGFVIPRELLLDPTSACNLRCHGCWAADYQAGSQLSFEKLDDILSQAEALGIPDCLMSGGEPLLRKADILQLCRRHRRMTFGLFTNGTLVDEALADEMVRLGNLNLFLSIEGWREETDARRGEGVYDRVLAAMDLLRSRNIGFAFSICYHAKNYETVCSDAYLDFLREKGCWFGWMFQYIPVGRDADLSLCCTPEQRDHVRRRVQDYVRRHGMVIIDFWNNGHLATGCVGAGSGFVHINARGDVEPCAFCHYSDSNLHEKTLAEALRSPFFRRFRRAQPFSGNPLRSCPIMDHPQVLSSLVAASGAASTHLDRPESPEELACKTGPLAEAWAPQAEAIYAGLSERERQNFQGMVSRMGVKNRLSDRGDP